MASCSRSLPFNFTAIAANLPTAPALLGNVVLWKPSPTQAYSANVIVEILEEAGMPPGVINMLHGYGPEIGEVALKHPELGGVHFTGSTPTFQMMWKTVGENMANYRQYPRLVGETGGKDFIFAHPSADVDALAVGLVRGAFEFQGKSAPQHPVPLFRNHSGSRCASALKPWSSRSPLEMSATLATLWVQSSMSAPSTR